MKQKHVAYFGRGTDSMALVIIDMQYGFIPTAYSAERGVLKLVERAKSKHEAIFVLTFKGSGRTLETVLEALKNYPLTFHVRKGHIDGSEPLNRAIKRAWKRGLIQSFSKMRFCGVYTSECVKETFLSMCEDAAKSNGHHDKTAIHKHTKMELVASACRDSWHHPTETLKYIRKQRKQFPNLKVA